MSQENYENDQEVPDEHCDQVDSLHERQRNAENISGSQNLFI
jgi:hypothetical protein